MNIATWSSDRTSVFKTTENVNVTLPLHNENGTNLFSYMCPYAGLRLVHDCNTSARNNHMTGRHTTVVYERLTTEAYVTYQQTDRYNKNHSNARGV